MTPDPDVIAQTARTLLGFERTIQYFGIVLSIIGVGCSIYAFVEFMKQLNGGLSAIERMVARSYLVGQGAVLFCQLTMMAINILVLTLPEIPMVMYAGQDAGAWIICVVLARKVLRNAMIVVLAGSSVHRVWTFHWLMATVRATQTHQHRRISDPPLTGPHA